MTFSLIATAVVSLALAQAGTTATTTTAQEAAPATYASEALSTKAADDKVICRKVRSLGSNLTTRDCRTAAQRRKAAEEARDALRNGSRPIVQLDTGAQ